jgi:hypothetical protein
MAGRRVAAHCCPEALDGESEARYGCRTVRATTDSCLTYDATDRFPSIARPTKAITHLVGFR